MYLNMMKIADASCRATCQNIGKCAFDEIEPFELSKHSCLNTYKKAQSIFLQGNISNGIFCVNSGKIKIVIVNNEGKESIVRLVTAGDAFGHRALFSGTGTYHASAITLEDSVVCFFKKEFILSAIDKHRSVALKFLAQLSNLVGLSEVNNTIFVHKNVRERLAGLLISFKDSYGVQEGDRICLDIVLSREEIAAIIGTTHETLARLLTELKNEKIIVQEHKIIYIIDEKKLIEFANI